MRGALPTLTRLTVTLTRLPLTVTVTLTRLHLTATLTRFHLTELHSIRIQIDPDPNSDPEKPCLLSVLSIRPSTGGPPAPRTLL